MIECNNPEQIIKNVIEEIIIDISISNNLILEKTEKVCTIVEQTEKVCTICFEKSFDHDKLALFVHSCGNYLIHKQCLYLWLVKNYNECLICRLDLEENDFELYENDKKIEFKLPDSDLLTNIVSNNIGTNNVLVRNPNRYNYNRVNMIDRFITLLFKKLIIFIFMFSFLISYLYFINKTYQLLFEYKENIYILIITCLIIFLGFFNRNRIIL